MGSTRRQTSFDRASFDKVFGGRDRSALRQHVLESVQMIRKAYRDNPETIDAHRKLFELYQNVDNAVHEADIDGEADALIQAQESILDAAISMPALNYKAMAYKLAIWRWDYEHPFQEDWPRGDWVAASLLEDLSMMTGLADIIHEDDQV
ncbi:MAG: hypothetical protein AAF788_03035 [Pseudomonadota bacterium]